MSSKFLEDIQHRLPDSLPPPYLLVPLLALSLAILKVFATVIYNLYFHPLSSYPGPRLWAAFRLPWTYHMYRGDCPHVFLKLHKKYGPMVRIAPNEMSYAGPQAWLDIYQYHPGKPEFSKDPSRQQKHMNGVPDILGANKQDHARYRKLLSHAFSDKGMREQEPQIRQYVELLMQRLGEVAVPGFRGESQDMCQFYNWTTFDLIGDLAFGEPFDSLRERRAHPWIAGVLGNIKFVVISGLLRMYGAMYLGKFLLPSGLQEISLMNFRYAKEKIDKRYALGGERGDFWDRVVNKSGEDNKGGHGMSKNEMVNNGSVLVLGGSETTATLLSAATYLLCTNERVLKKLVKEIRTTFKTNEEIDLTSVGKLKYLLAVLDEALRTHPPAAFSRARLVPKGGATVLGKFVPEDTPVSVQQYAAYHLDTYFHRPDEFIPERWLDEDPQFANDARDVFQPFSMGIRNCIGRNLAYAEMRLILAKVLWHYDIQLDLEKLGPQEGKNAWTYQMTWVVWERRPLWVKLSPAVR